jgi:hypothetical protein
MKTFSLNFIATCVAVLLLVTATLPSCKKDKTCYGKVHVTDAAGTAVNGAAVHLYTVDTAGNENPVTYDGVTDASGLAKFEVKLPAIFDVRVTSGSKTGLGVLRVDEPGKTGEVSISIN